MRCLLALTAILLAAIPLAAHELDAAQPAKPPAVHAAPPPDPDVIRQGGDTFADATVLEVSYHHDIVGTTVGYTDDYDEVCPYTQSTSPDVVYRLVNDYFDTVVDIDMCGSSYDTKIYVYDEDLALVACNDDFYFDDYCGMYVSRIDALPLDSDLDYFLVIDGYGGDAGDYHLQITEFTGHGVYCPDGAVLEDEPPLENEYVDLHNGGCNTVDPPNGPPFQHIASELYCGYSGWFLFEGSNYRDTDWFTITLPADGTLEITGDADQPTYMFELGPQDCDQVAVLQQMEVGPFVENTMVITGEPLTDVWFWVGPTTFYPPHGDPPQEYLWVIRMDEVVATEPHSWTAVKALFD